VDYFLLSVFFMAMLVPHTLHNLVVILTQQAVHINLDGGSLIVDYLLL